MREPSVIGGQLRSTSAPRGRAVTPPTPRTGSGNQLFAVNLPTCRTTPLHHAPSVAISAAGEAPPVPRADEGVVRVRRRCGLAAVNATVIEPFIIVFGRHEQCFSKASPRSPVPIVAEFEALLARGRAGKRCRRDACKPVGCRRRAS